MPGEPEAELLPLPVLCLVSAAAVEHTVNSLIF